MKLRSVMQALLVMLLWASCYPLITIGIAHAPHLSFAAMRALLAAAVLLGIAMWLRRRLPRGLYIWMRILIIGLGATSLGFFGMFHAAEFVAPGLATVIASSQPLLAAILAAMVLGEKLTLRSKVGLVLGFIGILVLVYPTLIERESESYFIGIILVLLAAVGVTISNVVIKQIAGKVDGFMIMGFQTLFGSVPLILLAVTMEEPGVIDWVPEFLVALIGLAVFGTAAVYWLWLNLLEQVALSQANAFSFLVPVLGLTIGILFFQESVSWLQGMGIFLVLLGIGVVATSGADIEWDANRNVQHEIR